MAQGCRSAPRVYGRQKMGVSEMHHRMHSWRTGPIPISIGRHDTEGPLIFQIVVLRPEAVVRRPAHAGRFRREFVFVLGGTTPLVVQAFGNLGSSVDPPFRSARRIAGSSTAGTGNIVRHRSSAISSCISGNGAIAVAAEVGIRATWKPISRQVHSAANAVTHQCAEAGRPARGRQRSNWSSISGSPRRLASYQSTSLDASNTVSS